MVGVANGDGWVEEWVRHGGSTASCAIQESQIAIKLKNQQMLSFFALLVSWNAQLGEGELG